MCKVTSGSPGPVPGVVVRLHVATQQLPLARLFLWLSHVCLPRIYS